MPNRVEVDLLGDAINSPVIHFPGRRFPGVLVQGDSLKILVDAMSEILELLETGDVEEARSVAEEAHELLSMRLEIYEKALRRHGFSLPYSE